MALASASLLASSSFVGARRLSVPWTVQPWSSGVWQIEPTVAPTRVPAEAASRKRGGMSFPVPDIFRSWRSPSDLQRSFTSSSRSDERLTRMPLRAPSEAQPQAMQHLWTLLVLIAAAINLAPALGVVSHERMSAFYGVDLENPNLQILMRHRAVLFGIVGGLLLVAAFHPPLRVAGYVVGFSSMVSFLVIAWSAGEYSAEIQRVIHLDVVGIVALAGAGLVHLLWLGTPGV